MPDPLVERIRDLIKQGGTTQAEFAARIEMTPDKLSKSLAGTRRFTSLDLALIADAAGVTVDWLLTGQVPVTPRVAARRSNVVDASLDEAVEVAERYHDAHEVLRLLGRLRDLPPLPGSPSVALYKDQGAALARRTLELMHARGFQASSDDLPAVLEAVFGIDVAVTDLPEGFGGLAWQTDDFRLILVQRRDYRTRQRFSLAHECAHILCGDAQNLLAESLKPPVGLHSTPDEIRANAFAANLLMPEKSLREVAHNDMSVRHFAQMVVDFQVSPSAMAARLESLGIGDPERRSEWRRMTTLHCYAVLGRRDDYLASERAATEERTPNRLANGLYAAFERGETTLRPLAYLLRRDVDSLYAQFTPADLDEYGPTPTDSQEYIP